MEEELVLDRLFLSKRIFIDDEFIEGGILVAPDGKIRTILKSQAEVNSIMYSYESEETFDYQDYIIMPGLIDSHVHINEPGREDWEGFVTATKAAAAGGFTTIADMPLNSIPPTTTVENLRIKQKCARTKIYVDIAFWGGIIPDNIDDIIPMIDEGVVGFKCFLCPSGVPEFPNVNTEEVECAMKKLQNTDAVFAFHAEICSHTDEKQLDTSESKKYNTYLQTRPPSMEINAIKLICDFAVKYNVRTHIVHLSACEAIPIIQDARKRGAKLTVETCHHYLTLNAEMIPDASTEYKCAPPIRNQQNCERLWKAICDGDINLVVSDHSPSTPGVKMLTYGKNRGDFIKAWGGIASVQFGLSLFWTHCQQYGLTIRDLIRLMCTEPAKLCGIDDHKSRIAVGYDADFCVWDPDANITITPDIIHFQNKANPYMGRRLKGLVYATFLRGQQIFQDMEKFTNSPTGKLVKKPSMVNKKIVKVSFD